MSGLTLKSRVSRSRKTNPPVNPYRNVAEYTEQTSGNQGAPSRIGGIRRCDNFAQISPRDVDRVEVDATTTAARIGRLLAEEHQHPAVRRPGWPLVQEAARKYSFAFTFRRHEADRKLAPIYLGEGDQVAARRPHRRRVAARAEADALHARAVGIHDVELLAAAAIGVEGDALAVGRIARR